jgi:hypothetical protein
MDKRLVSTDILFETTDILGRKIRTTRSYWKKIKEIKHRELKHGITQVEETLKNPDEVRTSVTDETILLYSKEMKKYDILMLAVKVLNGNGFLVTAYQTKEHKKKGNLIWQKEEKT